MIFSNFTEADLGKPLKKSKESRSETFDEGASIRNVGGSGIYLKQM
jgi:hypothetical protein